jgi:uncharacterized phage protein (TIGR02218 family)
MKILSAALTGHIENEVTTLASCWKLTLKDGSVLGFTNHSEDIVFEEVSYKADTGFTRGAVESSADLSVNNSDIEGMLNSSAITEEDIMAGKYDFAELVLFMVNYADLTQGMIMLRRGWLGEVSLVRNRFVAEVRGLTERLSKVIGEYYSPSCRTDFASGLCKINAALYRVTGSISAVSNSQLFFDNTRAEAAGYFSQGKITFTSGLNDGLSMEVKTYTPGSIMLVLPMPYDVAVGDSYSLQAGCDKTFATCRSLYNNAVNFRGEPHIPGTDALYKTAATR